MKWMMLLLMIAGIVAMARLNYMPELGTTIKEGVGMLQHVVEEGVKPVEETEIVARTARYLRKRHKC